MKESEAKIGTRVKSNVDFAGVPAGTYGIIDEDYETGVMVAWDLPRNPLPKNYKAHDGKPAIITRILRDGFNKRMELQFLDAVVE